MAHLAYVCGNRRDFRGPQSDVGGNAGAARRDAGGHGALIKQSKSNLGQSWARKKAWGLSGDPKHALHPASRGRRI